MRQAEHASRNAVTNFRVLLELYAGGPLPGWDTVERTRKSVDLRPGGVLFDLGDTDSHVYLLQSGIIRVLTPRPSGDLATLLFLEEGEIITNLEFLLPFPWLKRIIDCDIGPHTRVLASMKGCSQARAEAVTACQLVGYDLRAVEKMVLTQHIWARSLLTFFYLYALTQQVEEHSFKVLSVEQRYQLLLDQRPSLVRRLRQKDLAAYLGVTESGLSRVIARHRRTQERQ